MTIESSQTCTIYADVSECINYASWQNSVPFLKSLELTNDSDQVINDLVLELRTSPDFIITKQWAIQRLAAGAKVVLKDRDVQLDPDYLNGLNEAERGVVTLSLKQGDQLLTEAIHEMRVLARDEWGGLNDAGDLLAAFVMPNDPALAKIL